MMGTTIRALVVVLTVVANGAAFLSSASAQSTSDRTAVPSKRVEPRLERNGDPAVISARLQKTVEYLNKVIAMRSEPRTKENMAEADAILYTADKYVGAAYTGVEIRLDNMVRRSNYHDPVLAHSLQTYHVVSSVVILKVLARQEARSARPCRRPCPGPRRPAGS